VFFHIGSGAIGKKCGSKTRKRKVLLEADNEEITKDIAEHVEQPTAKPFIMENDQLPEGYR